MSVIISMAGEMVKRHEGFSKWAYLCTAGKQTIGYGRNIDKNGGPGITEAEALILLSNDLQRINTAASQEFPWFSGLNEPRQAAIIDMIYNLGVAGFRTFKQTISCIESGDYVGASEKMLISTWAKQVGKRAIELAEIIRTGEL